MGGTRNLVLFFLPTDSLEENGVLRVASKDAKTTAVGTCAIPLSSRGLGQHGASFILCHSCYCHVTLGPMCATPQRLVSKRVVPLAVGVPDTMKLLLSYVTANTAMSHVAKFADLPADFRYVTAVVAMSHLVCRLRGNYGRNSKPGSFLFAD